MTQYYITLVDRKILTLLEEIKHKNQTLNLLQRQALSSQLNDVQVSPELNNRLPASTLAELELVDTEAKNQDVQANLVCVIIYNLTVMGIFLVIGNCNT